MNPEITNELVWNSQMGDADAMEQLMLQSYAPVSYLANKILQNRDSAEEVTREVLKTIHSKLNSLTDPGQYQKWMCRITAARCMQILPPFFQDSTPPQWQTDLPEGTSLTEEESASLIQQMVDTLPHNQRLCILLLGCGGLSISAIAQMTGFSTDTVTGYIQQGQNTIQQHLWDLQERNIQLSGLSSLTGILRIAMFRQEQDDDAMAVVYGILGKEIPVPPDPEKRIIKILVVILVILILAVLAACGILFLKLSRGLSSETTVPTTQETTLPATTAGTEATTLPTTAETTLATELPTTEATIPETQATEPAAIAAAPTASIPASSGTASGGTSVPGSQVPSDAPKTGEDGHTHRYLSTRTNFNCETGGTRRYLCADCDYYYTVDLAPSGSHNFITVPAGPAGASATCTKPGTALKLCTKCNVASQVPDPDNLPALGHDYTSSVVAPTAAEQGYTLHTCSRCGDCYQDTFVDPIPAQTEAPAPSTEAPAASDIIEPPVENEI